MRLLMGRLGLFFVLACALTWSGYLGNWLWPSDLWPMPMNPLGPLVAAPLSIWLTEGKAGLVAWLRRIARFRAPVWVYAAATLIPLAIIFASIALTAATGAVILPLPELAIVEMLILVPVLAMLGPLPEELAFRGHGQHQLQQAISPLAAALVIGAGVVVWHLPLIVTGSLAWPWIATIVFVSVIYAWLYNAGGSVWPLVVLHLVVNYFGGEFLGVIVSDPVTQPLYALFYAGFYLAWAAIVVWRLGPSLTGRDPAPAAVPAAA